MSTTVSLNPFAVASEGEMEDLLSELCADGLSASDAAELDDMIEVLDSAVVDMNIEGKPNIVILDGPGIGGSGPLNRLRFSAYVEAGGPTWHPLEPSAEHIAKVSCAVKAADQAVAEYKLQHTN